MSRKQQWKIITVLILSFALADIILGKRLLSEGFGTASLDSADQPSADYLLHYIRTVSASDVSTSNVRQVGSDCKVYGFNDLSLCYRASTHSLWRQHSRGNVIFHRGSTRHTKESQELLCQSVGQLAWLEAPTLSAASLYIRYDNGVNLHHPEMRTVKHHEYEVIFFLFFLALQPPLGFVFYSPLVGFSLLAYEVS